MFDFAMLAYERQEWAISAQNFAKYLQTYPAGKRVADALFRVGECYREQRQLKQATYYWEEVVNRYPTSEGAPSAAYRLGAVAFNQGQNTASNGDKNGARPSLLAAARFFTFCVEKTKTPEARLAALYNKSRCHELLGDTKLQAEALNAVMAVQENNPYRETALLTLGTLQLQQDKKAESIKAFEQLIVTSRDNALIADASLRLAVLYQEEKKYDEAVAMFQNAVALPETSESPDGKWIAFSAEYAGNTDVYVVAATGGEPKRLTCHPGADSVQGWTPDGKSVLFASGRATWAPSAAPRFWTVPAEGGVEEPMALPRGFQGKISPTGTHIAYRMNNSWDDERRNYRGGQNRPIWIVDLKTYDLVSPPWTDSKDY